MMAFLPSFLDYMFIATLSYVRPLDEVDALIPDHLQFLDRHYATGLFIASGRLVPRTGGVILIAGHDRQAVMALLEQDPFHQAGVATYALVEFAPTKMQPGLERFVDGHR
jgi:uncharacterized protein YciI